MKDTSKAKGIGSINCQCFQDSVNCEPKETYDRILECDNKFGTPIFQCPYRLTIGTEYQPINIEGASNNTDLHKKLKRQLVENMR